jgi:hypothetical protein
MKRQRGRNRGGGGSGGSGGKPQQQNANRAFDSNGPEGVKVRGNAQHVFEKYQQLARDANAAGDRVLGENYLQHAEHYFRLLRALQPQRPPSEILGRDQFASGYDIDFEDESGHAQGYSGEESPPEGDTQNRQDNGGDRNRDRGEWQGRDRDDRARDERPRDDRPRDDRPRDDRPRDERPRDDRPRDERPRDDRPRDDRPRSDGVGRDRWRERDGRGDRSRNRDERPRDDRPREDRPRDERPRDDRPERVERDPPPVIQPEVREERPGPMLRDAEGGESHAPAFLQVARPAPAPAEAAPKPARRRRAPRTFEAGEGAPPSSETEEA